MKTKHIIIGIAVLAVISVLGAIQFGKGKHVVMVTENSGVPVDTVATDNQTKTDTTASPVAASGLKTYESKEFGVKFQYPKEIEINSIKSTPKVLLSMSLVRDKNDVNPNNKESFAAAYPVKGEPTLDEIRKKAPNTEVKLGANIWYRFVFAAYNKDVGNYVLSKNGIEYSYTFPLTQEDSVKKILSTVTFATPAK